MADLASGFSTMMRGHAAKAMRLRSKALFNQAMEAAGPLPPDIAAMGDDELLAVLQS